MNDEQAIRQLIDTWLHATRAGDVDTVLTLMAADVIFLIPGHPPMQGRDEFERSLRLTLADSAIDSTSEIDEVTVAGDMAYCRTRLTVTITSRHGQLPLQRTGHTLSIFRKSPSGQWLLTRDANMMDPA
ncbi:MAG: SgcJ/EcaC family oxidoreductase [Pseudomonadota bacterium]